RKNQTEAENFFWEKVRNRKLGLKFVRQKPIKFKQNKKFNFFYADFYCAEKKLVIEIDGKIHEKRKEYDKMRDEILAEMGYKVIRFKNEEIFNKWNEIEKYLTEI
ncbi:MAG: endonuclease domain-containing protein, partial [Brevinematales bacterium]|nr:endonuclease domain-containing protein [Brevinematales bacterium]